MGYSVTQGANYAQLAACIGIVVRIWSDPSSISAEEWQMLGLAIVGGIAAIVSAINRHAKGDITAGGFKK